MELKPGYKQSEVGVIPEDWRTYSLGKLLKFQNGRGFQQSEWRRAGLPIIRIQNLNDADADFNYFDGNIQDKYLVRPGDLLFAWSGTIGTSFGPRIWHGETGVLNQHIFRVSKLSSELALSYALHLLESAATHIASQTHGFKSSFVHVKKRDLGKVVAVLPPTVDEQERICEALKDFDSYLSVIERSITKKRDIKQAAMQELLSGKRRLPGFEGEWEEIQLADVAAIRNAKVVASSMPPETKCIELECIDQVTGRLLTSSHANGAATKYTFKRGDVLFGRLRAYLRKFWLASFDGICSTEIWPLIARDNRLSAGFLHLLVQSNSFVDAAGVSYGTHMPRSDWSVLRKFQLKLPPIPEQVAIATVLSVMDAELASLEARRDKTRELKQGMMQELLTGRIRLQ